MSKQVDMTKEREQLMNEMADKYDVNGDISDEISRRLHDKTSRDDFRSGFKAADAHPTEREMKLVEALTKIQERSIEPRKCNGSVSMFSAQALSNWNASKTKDGE